MVESRRRARQPAIAPPLVEQLEHYTGRWVAVDGGRVIASGDSALSVLKHAHERSVPDPLIFRVPAHPGSTPVNRAGGD